MDKSQRHIHQCLKKEHLQTASDSFQWDSENLVQERTFQQQQQWRLNISNGFTKESNEESGGEDLRVFDSLEVTISQPVKLNHVDNLEERKTKSQVFQDDVYSRLHCGSNLEMISKGVGQPQEGPLISVDESFLITEENLNMQRKEGVRKDGYMLITSTTQPVLMTSQNNSCDQPYLLHPQYGQENAIVATPPLHHRTLNAAIETDNGLAKSKASSELSEENAEPNQNQTKMVQQMDKMEKAQSQLEDIVERNKLTLGRSTTKYGSYAKAHALRIPQNRAKSKKNIL